MKKRKRLGYDDLLRILHQISIGQKARKICSIIGIRVSTLYRLIKKGVTIRKCELVINSYRTKNCSLCSSCTIRKNNGNYCPSDCVKFIKYLCPKLKAFPFMCNFCEKLDKCKKEKRIFEPDVVYVKRKTLNRTSKSKPKISEAKIKEFDQWFSPLILQGLSIEAIYAQNKEYFLASTRTVRLWIEKGYLHVKRIDLINAVTRNFSREYNYGKRVYSKNPLIKYNRTFHCFSNFVEEHPNFNVLQLDTVHGKKGDRLSILTIYDVESKFQIGLLLNSCTTEEVNTTILDLKSKMTDEEYISFFRILLCDNGPEFDSLPNLEGETKAGEIILNVFYAKPYASGDKGGCERNHEFFRYIIKKGISFDDLTQEKLNYYFSMINSYPRKALENKTPYEILAKNVVKVLSTN